MIILFQSIANVFSFQLSTVNNSLKDDEATVYTEVVRKERNQRYVRRRLGSKTVYQSLPLSELR
jgi:hypothetical protein